MPTVDSEPDFGQPSSGEPELLEYRAISPLAIVSALLGLLSATALASLVLWVVPLLGTVTSSLALARISRSGGALTGRKSALVGLALSIFFGSAAIANYLGTQHLLSRRADEVARQWFDALAHDEPHVAYQLGLAVTARARLSDPAELWNYYRNVAEKRQELERFVADPVIRTLLALDGHARVRLYDTPSIGTSDLQSTVVQVYAVTYDDGDGPKTFFVALTLERSLQRGADKVDWRVVRYVGGIDPR